MVARAGRSRSLAVVVISFAVVLASIAALLASGRSGSHAARSRTSAHRRARIAAATPVAPHPRIVRRARLPAHPRLVLPPRIATATLDPAAGGVAVPPAFLGVSMEYWGFAHDAGSPRAPDPLLARLLRGLASGGAPPTLRIGGRATDASWWDPRHRPRPRGVSFDITAAWLRRLRAVAGASRVRVMLGLNLALGRPRVAAAWARAAVRGLPAGTLRGLEIGNEPDLYGRVGWYRPHGPRHRVRRARGRHYDIARFTREFLRHAAAVRRAVPDVPLIGPGFSTPDWMGRFPGFLRASRRFLTAATYHRYPLRTCHAPRVKPTRANLLAPRSGPGIARALAPYVAQARARHLPFWITEMNSIACGGRFGVSNTFASTLWGLDTLLALAHAGVDGVDVHTREFAAYSPFRLRRRDGRWVAEVLPLYDAMRLFGTLTPTGTRVARVAVASRFRISAWSLASPSGTRRVVLIDKDPRARGTVRVAYAAHARLDVARLARRAAPARARHEPQAAPPLPPRAPARLVRLEARSLAATRVTLAGRTYGRDARLHGRSRVELVQPRRDGYAVAFQRPGVAVLTLG
jgi:hypothetical protein